MAKVNVSMGEQVAHATWSLAGTQVFVKFDTICPLKSAQLDKNTSKSWTCNFVSLWIQFKRSYQNFSSEEAISEQVRFLFQAHQPWLNMVVLLESEQCSCPSRFQFVISCIKAKFCRFLRDTRMFVKSFYC